jgi:hypothetical protein
MAFDPMSVLGIVGTTAGLLGFLVSTVENISIRLRDYKECVKKLQEYSHTVEAAVLELQMWSFMWSHNRAGRYTPYEGESYALFWGEFGLKQTLERLNIIHTEIEAITELLECRNIQDAPINWKKLGKNVRCPSKQEITDWHNILSQPSKQKQIYSTEEMSRLYRFLFAIYRNAELKARITNLRDRISELQKTSIALYRTNHESRTGDPIHNDLEQTAVLQEERRVLLKFLGELYSDNKESSVRWEFVLGNPSLRAALSRLRGASKVQLEFVFKSHTATDIRDIKIPYPKFRNLQRYEIIQRVNKRSLNALEERRDSTLMSKGAHLLLYERFELRALTPLSLREMSTNVLAAVAAARSAILLNKSPWIGGLCFCGISLYDDHEKNKEMAYFRRDDCDHVPDHFQHEAFLLLATLLAELAIGASIRVHIPECVLEEPEFELPEALLLPSFSGQMNWDTLSELLSQRMYEVPEQFVSVEYLEAMHYCYEQSQKLRRRDFVNDDLDICITKIETP